MSGARPFVVALVAVVAGAYGCTRSSAPVAVATPSVAMPTRVESRPAIFVAGNSTAARGVGDSISVLGSQDRRTVLPGADFVVT